MNNEDGGFLVKKEDMPKIINGAMDFSNKLLALFAFRLSCESKDKIGENYGSIDRIR